MGYPRELLTEDEEIIIEQRPHWWTMVGPSIFVVLSVVALIVLRDVHTIVTYMLFAVLGLALLVFLLNYLRWVFTIFVLTNERVIYRSGVIAKHGLEIPIDRITNIVFNQSIPERILSSGDLLIESAGESGDQKFSNIEHPENLQREIYRQVEAREDRNIDRMSGAARREPSIPEQIDQLDELRQRGVISQAEFDVKKQQLLDRM